ncbi:ABC transporter substrate-binding protein [Actinomyces bowdenii]|uniref:Carbohydrate ABC transporter substrate-binding protein n=1 Tax=Actinomyces bowdenii TaxID=131109 RepID=A0A853EK06_9ACTO|nr:ABC transporter substrate-binding protein [Actinomyces bowdenii]MBF0696932.1 carbohydrate ABC transporter substrate-binding protein [Actinomyces bowdenii]MDO5064397.1 ABC transporter substrate-binding protein [Actinomyces bowdenii]NYS69105.1 carbohydrate ABC transporter substrate-binding protein [Actinomyces bowdenii]
MLHLPARPSSRLLAVGCALALSSAGLAACSPSAGSDGERAHACAAFEDYDVAPAQVTVASALGGTEAERFEASVAAFEQCTGIDIVHTGSDSLEGDLLAASGADTATESGASPASLPSHEGMPDLAIIPQPGLAAELVDTGVVQPLPDAVNANVELGWDRQWGQAGIHASVPYAAPLMASVKSLVWYSPSAFAAEGYTLPTSWAELESLTAQIAADHPDGQVTPWCLGVSDGKASGWVMTDWLEAALLSTQGQGAYEAWADHSVPLDDPSALNALGEVHRMLMTPGHVPGGGQAAATRSAGEAGAQLVEGRCLMLLASSSFESALPPGTMVTDPRGGEAVPAPVSSHSPSAGSAQGASPEGTQGVGPDGAPATASATPGSAGVGGVSTQGAVSAFVLPTDEQGGDPVLVGADYLVAFSRGEAQTAVMTYLTSSQWAQERAALGGIATAHRGVDSSQIPSDVARRSTALLQSRETAVRMDASDRMPVAVGTEALWASLDAWTTGSLTSEQALGRAEEAWPGR